MQCCQFRSLRSYNCCCAGKEGSIIVEGMRELVKTVEKENNSKPHFIYLLFLIKRILNNLQQQYLFSYLDQKQHETQFQNISCDLATRHYLTNFTLASHWHGAKSGPVLVSQQWGGWGSTSWTKTTQSCFRWSDQQTAMLWPPFVNRMAFLRICSFGNFMLKPSWVHIT